MVESGNCRPSSTSSTRQLISTVEPTSDMKHLWTSLALAATVLSPTSLAAQLAPAAAGVNVNGDWVADFDEAAALARKQGKNLLVDFTGSDWCGWCIRLDREVFEHDSWTASASKDYVLVALDYPRGAEAKALVPNPERNGELAATYKVEGYPTILLMTPDGDVFGRTGYQAGGPEAYLAHMADLKAKGMPRLDAARDLVQAYQSAEGEAKLPAFGALAKHLAKIGSDGSGARLLTRVVREGMALDADGSNGMRRAAVEALVAAGAVDMMVVKAALDAEPTNENGLVERATHAFIRNVSEETLDDTMATIASFAAIGTYKNSEIAFEIYVNGAFFASRYKENPELARAYATKGLAIGSSKNEEWTNMLKELMKS